MLGIGLSQLKKLPEFIANRRKYCRMYNHLLEDVHGIITPQTNFDDVSIFNYVIRVQQDRRSGLSDYLKRKGIDTGIHWLPGNRFTWLMSCRGADKIPVTDRIGDEIMTLPLWSYMTDEIILEVANAVREFFGCEKIVQ